MKNMASFLAALSLALMSGILPIGLQQASAADSELGIAVQVLLGGQDSSKNVNQNNKLWFVIAPGDAGKRELIIASTSDIPQRISLSIGARKETNGVLAFDPQGTSKVDEWASFSKNDFLLAPKSSEKITMTIKVPEGSQNEVLQPALLVKAKAEKRSTAQYKIPTAMQFVQGMFLGVGTETAFATKFTIDDVYGQTTDQGRMLFIRFSNTGSTPITLGGTIQLNSLTFTGQNLGPFKFASATIMPGKSGLAWLAADSQLTDGDWRILVRAQVGQVEVTQEFQKQLSFPTYSALGPLVLNGGLVVIAIVVAIVSLRVLRNSRSAGPGKPFRTNNIVLLFFIYVYKGLLKRLRGNSNRRPAATRAKIDA